MNKTNLETLQLSSTGKMNTNHFTCAYFGSDWTITAKGFGSARQAEKHGLYMMPTAGVFGFAVIQEDGIDWELDTFHSMLSGKETVTQDDSGSYEVTF